MVANLERGTIDFVVTDAERKDKYASLDRITDAPEWCDVCTSEIKVQCFKGTGACSTNCEKYRKGEKPVEHPKGAA